ncbi:S6 family peptidase [Escherichia coli]|uniref:S6 family peptidase n=1 Tax=Escherichia coli TaxID=562 RepID=UPI000A183EE4|nr:S6 family peptidase [Escherichia coli]MEC9736546.1 S6 family peptidase [Escherichia coli]OSK33984.1 hemoglobin-binding protease hbp [Escherichia coli B671]
MNFVYSLRYSTVARCLVAVSELAKKNTKKKIRTALVASSMVATMGAFDAQAGTVNKELPYQLFRDFAENKGVFKPGAADIPIYNIKGELVGTLDKAPMPDFSSVDSGMGVATLIDPQYIVSVAHNGGYQGVSFGDGGNYYSIVDRNNATGLDFHAPRLNKLVTEVASASLTEEGAKNNAYLNKTRYPIFYRLGSGTQYNKNRENKLSWLGRAYNWLTGGTVGNPSSYQNGQMITATSGQVFNYALNGPMPIYGELGDSGSPLFAWDTEQDKWVLVGTLTAGNGAGGAANNWAVMPLDYIRDTMSADSDPSVALDSSPAAALTWRFDATTGEGSLSGGSDTYVMHGKKGNDLNAGKNLSFSGTDVKIDLADNVNQGAGYLKFLGDFVVSSANNSIWTGAGIIVDRFSNLIWKVNGANGDNLHKIGEGSLIVEGTGLNEGGLKVGNGTVYLNQQPDEYNVSQAFSSVNIAGGGATVVLANDKQVNPDNVSWGYRGGVLDLNGIDATFHKLNAADYGATIANNADQMSTVALDYQIKPSSISLHTWSESKRGNVGDLYEYQNAYSRTTDYFILKKRDYGFFPTSQNSDANWEYVGANPERAKQLIAKRLNDGGYIYHGRFEGNMNVENKPSTEYLSALVLDGSADITGTFTQENGRLVLQGHPVIHAYSTQTLARALANGGDSSVLTQPTYADQDDWEDRAFSFGKLALKGVDFGLGRNATLTTNVEADGSLITLGSHQAFVDKLDGKGTSFLLEEGVSNFSKDDEKSIFNGNIQLANESKLSVNSAIFNGSVTGGGDSWVHLSQNGFMNMTADSKVAQFTSQSGKLSLVGDSWKPKTFTVDVMDATNMLISLGVDVTSGTGDKIIIEREAKGGNNSLDISSMLDGEKRLKTDLTVASAPAGTPNDYFAFASFSRGFSTFKPETQVAEQDGKVLWQLKHSEPELVPNEDKAEPVVATPAPVSTPVQTEEKHTPNEPINTVESEEQPTATVPETIPSAEVSAPEVVKDDQSAAADAGAQPAVPVPDEAESTFSEPGSVVETDSEAAEEAVAGETDVKDQPESAAVETEAEVKPETKPQAKEPQKAEPQEEPQEVKPQAEQPQEVESQEEESTEDESESEVSLESAISETRTENTALLNKARDTFISHEYILSDRADRWQQVVDETAANGAWAFTEQSYGKHGDFTLSQSGLNIGFKKSNDAGTWWGVGADLNRGQAKADDYRNSYNLWGVNVYAGQQLSKGLFVDGTARFGQLTEDFKVHGELRDLSGKVKSHVFTGGLRAGYQFNFESADFSITPTVSLNGVKVSGSRLKGKDRSVELRSGDAMWLKTGIEAEKKIKDFKLKAGVWRNTNLNEMPGISLSDNWSQHQYKSKNLERITSSVGVEGKATDNLHIKAGVNAKFDGYFKNNYEGIFGIRYEF